MVLSRKLIVMAIMAFMVSAGCGHPKASPAVSSTSASDVTEFDSAVRDGDTDIISRLLKAKPEMINSKDENGKTPLTIATEKGDQDMARYLRHHGGHE